MRLPGARTWPPELRDARAYQGAIVYRHEVDDATLYVIVCGRRCGISRFQLRPGMPRERFRFGFDLGNNVVGWISGEPRAAASIRSRLGGATSKLDTSVDRCYIG